MSDISLVTYEKRVATIIRKAEKHFHVFDMMQVTEEMITEILNGYQNPYTLKKTIHALAFLQDAMVQTQVIRKPPILINKEVMLRHLREQGIVRRIADSTVYQAAQADVLAVFDQIEQTRTPFKHLVVTLLLFAMYTGARVDGALNVRNQDIVNLESGQMFIF